MLARRSVRCGVLAAFLAALVAGAVCQNALRGDVNGDGCVNVQDVRIVAAGLLKDAAECPDADVNADGRVDILDYQYVLAHSSSDEPAREEPPAQVAGRLVQVPRQYRACACVERVQAEAGTYDADECPVSLRFDGAMRLTRSAQSARYLLGLSPHAPPVRA